jgi:glyoxylase-like metal-dependent hydrolase (beta-lactamase superfamily II)
MKKAKVKILMKGFVEFDERTFDGFAQPTITLIEDGKNVIVVDPGTVKNIKELKNKLKKASYSFNDVTHVVVSHEHHDHYRNMGLFINSIDIDFWGLWKGMYLNFNQEDRKLSDNVKILMTPGHDKSGISLIVNTSEGKYAISGDVFYDIHGPKNDVFADNKGQLDKSRKKLLKIAEFIIPGHGDMFKVEDYSPK